ncbi:D-lactate dehydrogenase [Colletotrichum tofieldiae]|nr:D-lactate dehydrogenase [Colletotrichum tofieldiae]GKT74409.1 D-lactate dehydrogenase [Colletotrichum tofieldiae]
MAHIRARAPQAALQGLRAATPAPRRQCVALAGSARHMSSERKPERPATNEDKNSRTFQGQVVGSITQRLAREKAERERFAAEREKTGNSRNLAYTFGELDPDAPALPNGTSSSSN